MIGSVRTAALPLGAPAAFTLGVGIPNEPTVTTCACGNYADVARTIRFVQQIAGALVEVHVSLCARCCKGIAAALAVKKPRKGAKKIPSKKKTRR